MADEDPKPDQTPDPEVAAAPDQTGSPEQPETPAKPEVTEEEPLRFTQASFTKLTQELAEERRARQSFEEKLDAVLASRDSRPSEEEPVVENPVVEKALRTSRFGREILQQNEALKKTVQSMAEIAVTQGLAVQFPDLKDEIPQFIAWVKAVPGRAGAIQSGALGSDDEIVASYRAKHPAKRRATQANPAVPKPSPRVEGASAPRGVSRDIRAKIQESRPEATKGKRISVLEAFETALPDARRETKIAEE